MHLLSCLAVSAQHNVCPMGILNHDTSFSFKRTKMILSVRARCSDLYEKVALVAVWRRSKGKQEWKWEAQSGVIQAKR